MTDDDIPLAAFGAGSLRLWGTGVHWRQIEPSRGSFDWTIFDRLIARASEAQMQVLYCLGQAPDWSGGAHKGRFGPNYNPNVPRSIVDWANYIRAVARRYRGRIHAYQLWNEVNHEGFYSGDMTSLIQLAHVARQVLGEEDPAALLIGPSTTGSQGARGGPQYMAELLELGLTKYIDAVAVHLYVDPASPDEIANLMRQYRAAMRSAGAGHLPVWNTEFTIHSVRQDGVVLEAPDHLLGSVESVTAVVSMMVIALLSGCERSYWYGLDDSWSAIHLVSPLPPRHLLRAGKAYRALSHLLGGATVHRHWRKERLWLVEFDKDGGTFWLAWDGNERVVPDKLRIIGKVRAAHAGDSGRFDNFEDCTVRLQVTAPVLIVPYGPLDRVELTDAASS